MSEKSAANCDRNLAESIFKIRSAVFR
ncbi:MULTISPECIES: DUF6783 domain-containing protein [Robinsoniella]